MAKISFFFLLLLSVVLLTGAIDTANIYNRSSSVPFMVAQCRGTLYPRLCAQTLSHFVSNSTIPTPEQLAQIALKVSLFKATCTRGYIAKVAADLKRMRAKEYPAVKDCLEQINDGVDQLTNSVKELGRMTIDSANVFSWHQSNVQTWMSTALTDALMCLDGFPGHAMGSKAKVIIRAKVLNVAQVTSNALALFNRFASRHKASHATKP